MNTISFPGIGIDSFDLSPVAFTLPFFGGIEIRWYGIIITLGIILAFSYAAWRARQAGINFDNMLDIAIFTVISGIIGARLYYVLTSLDKYDSFYEMIAIWEGGIAIYGAIIGGGLAIFLVCKYKKIKFLKVFDAVAPGVMIGQILGRWGNFFNGEAYGAELTEGSPLYFIRMGLCSTNTWFDFGTREMVYVHPTFLYESLWNLVGFIIINLLYKKKKFDGQVFLMYITWYGFGRMFIEGLRTDSLYIGGIFRISQIVGFLCFVVGTVLLVLGLLRARRKKITETDYAPAYPNFVTTASASAVDAEQSEAQIDNDELDDDNEGNQATHTDISEKLERIFGNDSNSKE